MCIDRCIRCAGAVVLLILLGFAAFLVAGDTSQFFTPGTLRVLILSGRNNHDWRTTTPFLKKLLLDTGRFDVRVCEEPSGITAGTLSAYDALVVDYCGLRWGRATETSVESFVKSGKGMVVVHGASYGFSGLEVLAAGHVRSGIKEKAWPEWSRMVGGYWPDTPPKQFHGQRHSFTVKVAQADHPIFQGMPPTFIATDELYHQMTFLPATKILATAFDDPKMGGTGKEEPMLTAVDYGRGRVFYTALGHEIPAMREPGFMATFLRGTEWAATGKVTLPPDAGSAKTKEAPIRALVVTGGHDYETSFYTLFEGYSDLVWAHATSCQAAFKSDIRNKFDVLVLYDMSADLDENGRANLRNFLESGKGAVVLHHAIADYPTWPWWYKEVVGGRYLLKADEGMPASTFKHDEEMFVRTTENHPIVSNIGPMHLWDEAYKGMWISPAVKVLLRTDNVNADPPVTWVSPYQKSRVVYVALGHDSAAHRHPAYRQLVRNSILWCAGRLP